MRSISRLPAGRARIEGGQLTPARLEVSFLPTWLRWMGPGWGTPIGIVDLAPDSRYAIISEPSRKYLWVLARQPALTPVDDTAVRVKLLALGFGLTYAQTHPHSPH